MDIKRGTAIQEDRSVFTAYTARVTDHEQIQKYYIKLRMIQPTARHIVCAYWVKDAEICYQKDYHDDGEPGAGRQLLQLLKENLCEDTVVFVARKYGGIRMGPNRFSCYVNAACNALNINAPEVNVRQGTRTANNRQQQTPQDKGQPESSNSNQQPNPQSQSAQSATQSNQRGRGSMSGRYIGMRNPRNRGASGRGTNNNRPYAYTGRGKYDSSRGQSARRRPLAYNQVALGYNSARPYPNPNQHYQQNNRYREGLDERADYRDAYQDYGEEHQEHQRTEFWSNQDTDQWLD